MLGRLTRRRPLFHSMKLFSMSVASASRVRSDATANEPA
jgi:hypothetical protein